LLRQNLRRLIFYELRRSRERTMKPVSHKGTIKGQGWILFFYSVPSKPVSNRMKVWRKLTKAGAVQLKGSVYILPYNDEHYEFLQWLASEIGGMKGEAGFVRTEKIDTMKDPEIITLFDQQRAHDYKFIGKALDDLERRLSSIQKGGKAQNVRGISEQFAKILKNFEEVQKVDFFSSKEGQALNQRIKRAKTNLKTLSGAEPGKEKPLAITPRRLEDYHGKTWVTRKKPFIDRMASAWLIRRFIDKHASFDFIDEKDVDSIGRGSIVFDMRGGEFTHVGDLCTFEALVKSFGFKDKTVRKMAEIIHDLDMKDEKYRSAEAKGLEDILIGIRKAAKDDADALERGMTMFEMLYVSKS
jgi:hypothetical protein